MLEKKNIIVSGGANGLGLETAERLLKEKANVIIFDLDKQQIMTSKEDLSGECEENYLKKPKILEPHIFSEELVMLEAWISDYNYDSNRASSELLKVHINGSGFVTPFSLKFALRDSSNLWIIESIGIMGKLELREI